MYPSKPDDLESPRRLAIRHCGSATQARPTPTWAIVLVIGCLLAAAAVPAAIADPPQGSIVAWGCGNSYYDYGQCDVPVPNSGFIAIAAGEVHSVAIQRVPGDADADGDVDLLDYTAVFDYVHGPGAEPQTAGWPFFDTDSDGDVDLQDYTRFVFRFERD